MKQGKTLFLLGAFVLGFGFTTFAQVELPEVTVKAVRYKYLSAVGQKDLAQPVKMLEQRAAEYDVKSSNFYEEDYDGYFISFYIPDGRILASYDADGKMLSTVEKYKDIALPLVIRQAVYDRYPKWKISHDVYLVNYYEADNRADKVYKLTLQNGDKRLRVKMNEKGEFLK